MSVAVVSCRGVINSVVNKATSTSPIVHCYTAVGHSKAVLSLYAIDDLLFTGSKGRLSLLLFVSAYCHPHSSLLISAPRLGVYYFLSLTVLSVRLSIHLSVTDKLYIDSFLFLDGIEQFFGRQFSMTPSTKRRS